MAHLFGALMRNAQLLLIWGASDCGSLLLLRAAGVFVLQSCCNHSCSPNCSTENAAAAAIYLAAAKPVAAGSELTVSYVPLALPRQQRQALLSSYGFVCCCPRCEAEAQQQQQQQQQQQE